MKSDLKVIHYFYEEMKEIFSLVILFLLGLFNDALSPFNFVASNKLVEVNGRGII
jgi:hypothetical protein